MEKPKLRKAESYIQAGKLDKAEKELRKLLSKNNKIFEAWLMLASVHGRAGRFSEAVFAAKKVIAVNSKQPMAYSILGSSYVCLGQLEDAIKSLEMAHKIAPKDTGILYNLANAYYDAKKISEAKKCYQQVLNVNDKSAQSNFGIGNCCHSQGLWNEAIQYYLKTYAIMPDNYDINMSLGKAYMNFARTDDAYDYIKRATNLTRSPSVAYYELAHIQQLRGKLEDARLWVEKSLEHDASNSQALAKRIEINYKMGHYKLAHEQIKKLLPDSTQTANLQTVNNLTPALLLTWGKLCHKFDECQEVIGYTVDMLKTIDLISEDRISLNYLLGKLYDNQGAFDNAFDYYQKANSASPSHFDRTKFSAMIDYLIENYNAESIEKLPSSACADDRPIFIVGMPRSGTSLVEQILSSHPDVYGAGELTDIKSLASTLFTSSGVQQNKVFSNVQSGILVELSARYLSSIEMLCGDAICVTNKMPSNFIWLGFIMQLFPKARIIHCNRDPRDNCLSIYFQTFTKSHDYSNDLGDLAFYYRQYEKLMRHWRDKVNLPILDVHYKNLVEDVEAISRQMISFIGLEWNENCLNFYQSQRATATASWDQVRQPIYTKSLGRWEHYQKHLGVLLDEFGSNDVAKISGTTK